MIKIKFSSVLTLLLVALPILSSCGKAASAPEAISVGTFAPEIIGTDVAGKPIKLSDFRGKVVMLDFFGNW